MSDSADVIYRVTLRMEVAPGQEPMFEAAWLSGARVIGMEPANLGQWLSRSSDEESVYYIVSDWTDERSFRAYEQSERHREHRSRLHPYRLGGSMSAAYVLHRIPGPGVGI